LSRAEGRTEATAPTAAYYRNVAEEITGLARRMQLPEVGRELLELAERFRRMAAYVERRYPDRRGLRDDTAESGGN
jgi:hypothetical protein